MRNPKPERLILKIPKHLWLWRTKAPAFCMTGRRAMTFLSISIGAVFFLLIFHSYIYIPFIITLIETTLWVILLSWSVLLVLPTIFVRKECFECQFGFHIIAHERNHLLLGRSEEIIVEEETLRQTGNRLISILLSNPSICKGCPFLWGKMYCQATLNYLERK